MRIEPCIPALHGFVHVQSRDAAQVQTHLQRHVHTPAHAPEASPTQAAFSATPWQPPHWWQMVPTVPSTSPVMTFLAAYPSAPAECGTWDPFLSKCGVWFWRRVLFSPLPNNKIISFVLFALIFGLIWTWPRKARGIYRRGRCVLMRIVSVLTLPFPNWPWSREPRRATSSRPGLPVLRTIPAHLPLTNVFFSGDRYPRFPLGSSFCIFTPYRRLLCCFLRF